MYRTFVTFKGRFSDIISDSFADYTASKDHAELRGWDAITEVASLRKKIRKLTLSLGQVERDIEVIQIDMWNHFTII